MEKKKSNAGLFLPQLRLKNRDSAELLTVLKVDWPVAVSVLDKLVALISVSSHAGKDTHAAVHEVVERALAAYSEALYLDDRLKYPDPIRISVFLNVVVSETCRVMEVEFSEIAEKIWTIGPTGAIVPSGDDGYSSTESRKTMGPMNIIRRALYDLLASRELKIVLKEWNHETAILDGHLALCD